MYILPFHWALCKVAMWLRGDFQYINDMMMLTLNPLPPLYYTDK